MSPSVVLRPVCRRAKDLVRRKRLWATLAGLPMLALMLRLALFSGPYRMPDPLPEPEIIDLHCHTAGLGGGDSGCFISRELEESYKFSLYLRAFGTTRAELQAAGDGLLVDRIARHIDHSTRVSRAVVLAMDGPVDSRGELDRGKTQVYVPNEFVARQVAQHPQLLFGASINPLRHDALARLEWAATNGAVLVKWIPSVMHFDPSDPRIVPFYRRMKELGMPLLCHAGQERSFTAALDELCDPRRLRLPLEMGLTVIAAHIASTGANEGQRDTDHLRKMMSEFPNLHSEISSLTQANKLGYLREAVLDPVFHGRLCYGSDFPLVNTPLVSPWMFPLNLTREQMASIAALDNPWDADVTLKTALGVPADIFRRTATLLRLPAGVVSRSADPR